MTKIFRSAGFALAFGNMAILFPAPNLNDFRLFVGLMILGTFLILATEKSAFVGNEA